MDWMIFFGCSLVILLIAIHSLLRSMLHKMKEIHTRIELIHEHLIYSKAEKIDPIPISRTENPTSRSESAKRMWAKRRAKQVIQKTTSEKLD